ncbi:MAG: hypothetical protein EON93_00360 [Burkholderiales bacterium]|nr:MAG: hypothetical protein EON93_00360 [Burkholderiales bacterium]
MNNAWRLTKPSIALVVMYLSMAISWVVFEPAYTGYLVAFALFIFVMAPQIFGESRWGSGADSVKLMGWVLFIGFVVAVTIAGQPALRDLFRDSGAIFSFLLGLFIIPRALGRDWERPLFTALSTLALIVSLWTLVGASRAYLAGASAYEWRGVYVPFAHTWLPYLLIAEYVRSRSVGASPEISFARIGLCTLALLLSLSRTGLVLLLIFGPVTLFFNARKWLFSGRGILLIGLGFVLAAFALPKLLGLDVVQQRIDAGVGNDDLSLAWRAMENLALYDFIEDRGWWRWLTGFGLGARMPLPWGIVDFMDNTSIPHLHNSYMTLVLKFGCIGLGWILLSIGMLVARAHILRNGAPVLRIGGTWILLFVVCTAYTLQGMSEWSHLTFLGLSCALLAKAGRANERAAADASRDLSSTTANPGAAR